MCYKVKDHCTLWFEGNWSECCALHDKRYARVGLSKYQADVLLRRCVRRKHSNLMANIMFIGVTLFGHYSYYKAQGV